jgi:hypothetical protein
MAHPPLRNLEVNSVGCIGITETPSAAQTLCQEYTFRQLSAAAT